MLPLRHTPADREEKDTWLSEFAALRNVNVRSPRQIADFLPRAVQDQNQWTVDDEDSRQLLPGCASNYRGLALA
jgi:hypothetical protein